MQNRNDSHTERFHVLSFLLQNRALILNVVTIWMKVSLELVTIAKIQMSATR